MNNEEVLQQIRDKVDHPATVKELLQVLRIPRESRATFKRILKRLVDAGHLIEIRGERFGLPDKMNLIVGRVTTNPRGFGFVEAERPSDDGPTSIFIPGVHLNQAIHGDRVVVRVERARDSDRAEGRIIRILERGTSAIVGRYDEDGRGRGFVVPFDRRLVMDVEVPSGESMGAKPGEMVTLTITTWPTQTRPAQGRVFEVLGDINAPGVDTAVIIRKYNLSDVHSDEAIAEALKLGSAVKPKDIAGRTDFREWPTVTIDGEHARDFDDAISLDKLTNGNYWLAVHIADVSHYVREGTALDKEAYERSTSVYFPERAVHMFPSELSTGLCSLKPKVDRLVQSCLMEVDRKTGQVIRYEMHDGVIHSHARMTYTEVSQILTDRDPVVRKQYEALVPLFERMKDLFEILNQRRRRRGSVDFDLKESEILMGDDGMIDAIVAAERNVAHRLIEEFMLLANETVAEHLEQQGVPTLYRVHEDPDPMKVEEFEQFIGALGYALTAPADRLEPRHFQRLVEKIRGTPEEKPIAMLMLRTMQKARYEETPIGHFGLATRHYAHFTSPIRRYPDLVVHRSLRESRQGMSEERRAELQEDLPDMGRHTSERERRANDAERELVAWKKVRFMADKVGDEFTGFVTGVSAFGLHIELVEHLVEGMVHVSTMADDYYRFVEKAHLLKGEKHGRVYRLGDKVSVQVIRVDLDRRLIDLGLTEILEAVSKSERNRGARRSTARPTREARRNSSTREERPRRSKSTRPGPRERAFKKAARRKKR
ncbi:MAG: ribonuclease R [Acidobacteria bacterium]|nr:ribonuclease R [Acidobacteriota bacterium]